MGDNSSKGFASMDEEDKHDKASKGGQAAHQKGTAHEFSSEEVSEVGHMGGQDEEHMSEIEKKGGQH